MLRILAMIGDAQASSHVRTALTGYADLVFARDRGELVRALHQQEPDLIVLGIREAADATVSLTVQETIERFPATRLVLSCRVDGADMRALASSRHLDLYLAIGQRTRTTSWNLTGAVNGDAIVRRTYNTNGTLRTDSLRIRTYADLDAGGDTTSHRYGQTFGYDIEGRRIWMHIDSLLAPRVSGVVKDTIYYAYDSVTGALATVTDVLGSTWRYAYDAGGRIDSTFYPGAGVEVQTFDGEGRDSTRIDRLTTVVDTINNDLLFHDARDHIIKVRTPFDTTAFRYTPLGSVAITAEQNQDGGRENQQFNMDGLGNMFQELTDFFQFGSLHTYRYEPHTGRLRATRAPNVSGIDFDTSTYDPAGNRNWQFKYDLMNGWSYTAPYAQELSFNYYAADNTLRLLDRDECYLQKPSQANCTPQPAGNFAGAYEEYRYDALGRRILVRTRRDQWCVNTTGCYSTMTRNVWDGNQVLFEVRVPAWTAVSADTLEADTTFIGGPGSAYGPYGRVLYTHGLGIDAPLGVVRLGYSFGDSATNWNGPQDLVLYRNWRGIPSAVEPAFLLARELL